MEDACSGKIVGIADPIYTENLTGPPPVEFELEIDDSRGHIYHAFTKPLAEHIAQHRISPRVRGQLETNTAESQ